MHISANDGLLQLFKVEWDISTALLRRLWVEYVVGEVRLAGWLAGTAGWLVAQ